MKIIMVCKQDYYITLGKLSEMLKGKSGMTCIAVTFNTRTARILSNGNVFSRIYNFPDFMREKSDEFPGSGDIASQLKALDRDFQEDVLNKAISIDRLLFPVAMGTVYQKNVRQYSYNEILGIMFGNYRFWLEIFQKEAPNYIVGEIGNSSEYLAWAMAERYNCRYLMFSHTRILKNRFFVCDNPIDKVQKLEDIFTALKDRKLSAEERKNVELFLNEFVSKGTKPQYFGGSRNPFKFDFKRSFMVAKDAMTRARVPSDKSDRNFMLEDKDQLTLCGLFSHRIMKAVRYVSNLPLFEKLPEDTDYFFFALHVQPEVSTLLYGLFYDNQVAVVENICKCLPIGYRLVVKDHPGMVGRRTREFYKELKKFPNVILVAPETDSHEIIKKSVGVITITGTTGLEGMLYEKPVIVFGDTIYNTFDLVYKPNGYRELPAVLRRAITDFKPDRDLLLKFLLAMELSSYEGFIPDPVDNPEFLSNQNMEKVAEAIIAETQN